MPAEYQVARKYGLTVDAYRDLLAEFPFCAICGQTADEAQGDGRPLCIDHHHGTGQIRGLLCKQCNFAVGLLADSSDIAFHLWTYLAQWDGV